MTNTRPRPTVRTMLLYMVISLMTVFAGAVGFALPANAANVGVNQCNYADEGAGGLNTECEVTVVNNLDMATGVTTSTVTVNDCHGAANAEPTCVTNTTTTGDLVTDVNQCNNSTNAGGGTVICRVSVTNNITGNTTLAAATVNQCVGSGEGGGTEPTLLCTPEQSTTNAIVDQCNGSGNGGGGQERVQCTVATESTSATALIVEVTQCNDSGNGGGAYVTCETRILNNIIPPIVVVPPDEEEETPTPGDGTDDGGTPDEGTPGDGGTPDDGSDGGGTPDDSTPGDDDSGTPSDSSNPPGDSGTPGDTDKPELAVTGANDSSIIAFGAMFLATGVLLLALARRNTRALAKN